MKKGSRMRMMAQWVWVGVVRAWPGPFELNGLLGWVCVGFGFLTDLTCYSSSFLAVDMISPLLFYSDLKTATGGDDAYPLSGESLRSRWLTALQLRERSFNRSGGSNEERSRGGRAGQLDGGCD